MADLILKYPLDLTGINPTNLVTGDPKTLPAGVNRAIVPSYGPFYSESLVVRDAISGQVLTPNVHYVASQLVQTPTLKSGKEVMSVVVVIDAGVADDVELDYQVVGGDYSASVEALQTMINNLDLDNRTVSWGDILGIPDAFVPTAHLHDVGDLYGFEYLVEALEMIRTAILMGDTATFDDLRRSIGIVNDFIQAHLIDHTNPHQVTKDQVGLSSVENYAVATQAEAEAGARDDLYMTPLKTSQAITALAGGILQAHIDDTNNPHHVNKTQVGLGNVQNYAVATTAEAQAGLVDDKYMTPLKTKDAINALAGNLLTAHTNDLNNPHQVTKAQVGLGSVENYTVASNVEATAGTANNRYMTPLRVKEAIDQFAGSALNAHIANVNNPHSVTKAQVGLGNVLNYGIATTAEALAGTSNTKYSTPLRVQEAIDQFSNGTFATHVNNTNNPHSVTKAQVGLGSVQNYTVATTTEARAGTADNRYMTPLKVKEAIDVLAANLVDAHAALTNNPHSVTKTQVGLSSVQDYGIATQAEAEAGASNLKYMTPLRTSQAISALAFGVINNWIKSTANARLRFGDSVRLEFGTGGDLQIYADGTKAYIDMLSTGVDRLDFRDGTAVRAYLERSTGRFWATDWGVGSDVTIKKDFEPIVDGLIKVLQLEGLTFTRTDIPGDIRQAGTIAQQVEKVLPEAVNINPETGKLSVSDYGLSGLFISAFHDVNAELVESRSLIRALTSRLDTLEKEVTVLKGGVTNGDNF